MSEKNEKTWCIYGLIDPRDRKAFYVGLTNNIDLRIEQHRFPDPKDKTARAKRIREIQPQHHLDYEILEEGIRGEFNAWMLENYWIVTKRKAGHKLTNNDALAMYKQAVDIAERHKKKRAAGKAKWKKKRK